MFHKYMTGVSFFRLFPERIPFDAHFLPVFSLTWLHVGSRKIHKMGGARVHTFASSDYIPHSFAWFTFSIFANNKLGSVGLQLQRFSVL